MEVWTLNINNSKWNFGYFGGCEEEGIWCEMARKEASIICNNANWSCSKSLRCNAEYFMDLVIFLLSCVYNCWIYPKIYSVSSPVTFSVISHKEHVIMLYFLKHIGRILHISSIRTYFKHTVQTCVCVCV